MDNLSQQSNHTGEGEMNNFVDVSRMNPMWPYPHPTHPIERFPQFRDYFHDAPSQPVVNDTAPQRSISPMVNNVAQVISNNGVQQTQQQPQQIQQQSQDIQQQQTHQQIQQQTQQHLQQQFQQQNQIQQQLQQQNQQIQQQIQQQTQQQIQQQLQQQTQQQIQQQLHQQTQQIQQQIQQQVQQIQQQPQQATVVNSVPVMGPLQTVLTQGLSQSVNHTSSNSSPTHENPTQILTRMRLQDLVREVDPTEQLDEDVEEVLLQIADDFVDSAVTAACLLAKHRKSNTVEVKDLQLHLERNWNMWIPGFGTDELRPYKRSTVTEAHKQRLTLIRKTLKKY